MARWLSAISMVAAYVATFAGCAQLSGLSDLVVDDCAGCDGGRTDGADLGGDGAPSLDASDDVVLRRDAAPPGEGGTLDAGGGDDGGGGGLDAGTRDASFDAGPFACTGTAGPAQVKLATFCIDKTEVTNRQYAAFLAAKGTDMSGMPLPACGYKTTHTPKAAWPATPTKQDAPVVFVDWCDAYAFCAWAGKRMCGAVGGGASSKTSAADKYVDEWYIACSADGANVYPYTGAYQAGRCNEGTKGTATVASYTGCEGGYSGIFDMVGNAYEWENACEANGSGSDGCLIRGGSWEFGGTNYGTCAAYFNDYTVTRNSQFEDTGFRCCSP